MKNPSVVIIKKPRRAGHHGHHGGAWKVAYADFVTAMMAFFLVMWLVGQSQGVRQAVAGYFRDPGIFDHQKSNGAIPGGEVPFDSTAPPKLRVTDEGAVIQVHDLETLAKTAGRLKDLLGAMPEFKRLGSQIEIELTPEGLRVQLLETSDGAFFDTGSAVLKPETERILATISRELGSLTNHVIVEGHTDARPYSHNDRYTNWELSADRANAARRAMERAGLRRGQIQGVRGFADTRLRVTGDPFDARNRRVSIIVQNLDLTAPAGP